MIYIYVYIWLLVLAFYYSQKAQTERNKKKFIIFAFITFALLGGLRAGNVGKDTVSYLSIFQQVSAGIPLGVVHERDTTIELGYLCFVKIISFFTKNEQVFLLIQSSLICIGISKFLYDNSKNIYLSMAMFYALLFTSTMNIMRQYLALVLVIQCISLIDKRKYLTCILIMVMAILIHKSSIIFLFILFAYVFKNNRYFLPTFGFIGLLACYLLTTNYLSKILVFLGYGRYIGSHYMKAATSSGIMAYVYTLISITGILIYFLIKNKKEIDKSLYNFYLLMSIVGTIVVWLTQINSMFSRFGTYFIIFMLLLLPEILEKIKYIFINSKNIRVVLFYMIYIGLFIASYYSGVGYEYYFLIR